MPPGTYNAACPKPAVLAENDLPPTPFLLFWQKRGYNSPFCARLCPLFWQ